MVQYSSLDYKQYSDFTIILLILICMWVMYTILCNLIPYVDIYRFHNQDIYWFHYLKELLYSTIVVTFTPPIPSMSPGNHSSVLHFYSFFHFEDVIFRITLCNHLRFFFSLSIILSRSIQAEVVGIICLFLFIAK